MRNRESRQKYRAGLAARKQDAKREVVTKDIASFVKGLSDAETARESRLKAVSDGLNAERKAAWHALCVSRNETGFGSPRSTFLEGEYHALCALTRIDTKSERSARNCSISGGNAENAGMRKVTKTSGQSGKVREEHPPTSPNVYDPFGTRDIAGLPRIPTLCGKDDSLTAKPLRVAVGAVDTSPIVKVKLPANMASKKSSHAAWLKLHD